MMRLEAIRQEVMWSHLNSSLLWECLLGVKVVLLSYLSASASCDTGIFACLRKRGTMECF